MPTEKKITKLTVSKDWAVVADKPVVEVKTQTPPLYPAMAEPYHFRLDGTPIQWTEQPRNDRLPEEMPAERPVRHGDADVWEVQQARLVRDTLRITLERAAGGDPLVLSMRPTYNADMWGRGTANEGLRAIVRKLEQQGVEVVIEGRAAPRDIGEELYQLLCIVMEQPDSEPHMDLWQALQTQYLNTR